MRMGTKKEPRRALSLYLVDLTPTDTLFRDTFFQWFRSEVKVTLNKKAKVLLLDELGVHELLELGDADIAQFSIGVGSQLGIAEGYRAILINFCDPKISHRTEEVDMNGGVHTETVLGVEAWEPFRDACRHQAEGVIHRAHPYGARGGCVCVLLL